MEYFIVSLVWIALGFIGAVAWAVVDEEQTEDYFVKNILAVVVSGVVWPVVVLVAVACVGWSIGKLVLEAPGR